jgi:hypothetical protein
VLAARGALADCFARLDASTADPDLIALCKCCLAADRTVRPADASEVARVVAAVRAAAEERARRAELERVRTESELRAAEVQIAEQRKRRRIQAILGLTFTALVLLGVAFAWWIHVQQLAQDAQTRERQLTAERKVTQALEVAGTRRALARAAGRDPAL